MSVYVITGVSSGIGFELLRQLSSTPSNTIIGLVRNVSATTSKITNDIGSARNNIHILAGDLTDYASLEAAAASTAKILGDRGVDYLVANAGFPSFFDAFSSIGSLGAHPTQLSSTSAQLFATNVTGNVHLFNLFLPLVLKSKTKKVIAITSGHADLDLINDLEVENSALYAASKAALNVVVAKFNAQYKREGVLFVSMSPGVVDVGHFDELTPEQAQGVMGFMEKIKIYAPEFKGPIKVDDAVKVILKTWERLSIEDGFGGKFISQHGDRQWI